MARQDIASYVSIPAEAVEIMDLVDSNSGRDQKMLEVGERSRN